MTFEEYLISKKIDANRFIAAEPALFHSWKSEFEQVHPNSFTVQKLNLINPVRRKYQLPPDTPSPVPPPKAATSETASSPPPQSTAPKVPRPMMRPKPKI